MLVAEKTILHVIEQRNTLREYNRKDILMKRSLSQFCGVFALLALVVAPLSAEVKTGDQAPDFALAGSDGKVHKLSDYKGKAVIVAWFPKAFTGG